MNDFSPSIETLNAMINLTELRETIQVVNPVQSGTCSVIHRVIFQLGDWARVSVYLPIPSRIRSMPGSSGGCGW